MIIDIINARTSYKFLNWTILNLSKVLSLNEANERTRLCRLSGQLAGSRYRDYLYEINSRDDNGPRQPFVLSSCMHTAIENRAMVCNIPGTVALNAESVGKCEKVRAKARASLPRDFYAS